jgi:cytochrome c oxidase subunit 3
MSQATTAGVVDEVERPYFDVSWQKLVMWLFIVSDAIIFVGFLASYMFCRLANPDTWPALEVREGVFSMNFITAMTFVLITSSATMACGVHAAHAGDRKRAVQFTLLTALIGFGFLGMQAIEWSHFIHDGARLTTNPWGVAGFSAYFFMMTGFHGTHVLIGATILLITVLRTNENRFVPEKFELAGLYWHFVDLVWVFIFGCFYLL